jgi:hypothetical protein
LTYEHVTELLEHLRMSPSEVTQAPLLLRIYTIYFLDESSIHQKMITSSVWCKSHSSSITLAASNNCTASGMTSRCGWRTPSVPIQIRASPCSIHGTDTNSSSRALRQIFLVMGLLMVRWVLGFLPFVWEGANHASATRVCLVRLLMVATKISVILVLTGFHLYCTGLVPSTVYIGNSLP